MRLVLLLIFAALAVGLVGAFIAPATGSGFEVLGILLLVAAVARWYQVGRQEADR